MPLFRQVRGRIERLTGRGRAAGAVALHSARGAGERRHLLSLPSVSDSLARVTNRRMAMGVLAGVLVVSFGALGLGEFVAAGQPALPPLPTAAAAMTPVIEPPPASDESPLASGTAGVGSVWDQLAQPAAGLTPSPAGEFAKAASFAVALARPLQPNEVFGVVPYWELPRSATLDLTGLTTVIYAGLQINADGSIETSGPAWDGFLSQDFMNLIAAAHDDGARVVLSVQDFDQSSLDQLVTSPSAASNLAQSVLLLLKMRDLDGVNLDLEGQGAQDRAGVTNLATAVSETLKNADAHYQVTMDTDSSSARDLNGIYDLPALNEVIDGFLVTEDQFNLAAVPSSSSEMTSATDSLQATINEYLSELPASKVVAVLPLFGLSWPTTDGTLGAKPAGTPVAVTAPTTLGNGRGRLWDAITKSGWSPYRVSGHWHEAFFETHRSLRLASRTVAASGIAGIGLWGLGTDGTNDARFVLALGTGASGSATGPGASTTTSTLPSTPSSTTTTTTTTQPAAAQDTTTTSAPAAGSASSSPNPYAFAYSGVWIDAKTSLLPTTVPAGTQTAVGVLSKFKTAYRGLSCLTHEQFLDVFVISGHPDDFYVIARTKQGDCTNAAFVFYDPNSPIPASGS